MDHCWPGHHRWAGGSDQGEAKHLDQSCQVWDRPDNGERTEGTQDFRLWIQEWGTPWLAGRQERQELQSEPEVILKQRILGKSQEHECSWLEIAICCHQQEPFLLALPHQAWILQTRQKVHVEWPHFLLRLTALLLPWVLLQVRWEGTHIHRDWWPPGLDQLASGKGPWSTDDHGRIQQWRHQGLTVWNLIR